jgi:hypothetical protein
MEAWILEHWFDLLQTVSIVGGLAFTAHTILKDSEVRKIANLIALNQQHQTNWKELYEHPELARITDERVALDTMQLSHEERVFVTSLILHLSVVHRATKAKMFVTVDGLKKDVNEFFSLPIPKAVWEKIKSSQEKDFVAFVEAAMK